MTADETRAAILAENAPTVHERRRDITETREERRKRMSRDRARLSRERAAARRATAPETAPETARTQETVRTEPVHTPVERSNRSGDGRILGAVHGIGGPDPKIMNFRRDPAIPTEEEWRRWPRATRPDTCQVVISRPSGDLVEKFSLRPWTRDFYDEDDVLTHSKRLAALLDSAPEKIEQSIRTAPPNTTVHFILSGSE